MLMPGLDGFGVLARLKADPATAALPVIVLTAAPEREHLVRAFAAGAVDFVTKPFVAEELLARVRTHLELKFTRDHLARVARERSELAALVAHDLKNPLSAIHFCAQLLQRGGEGPPTPARLAEVIARSTDDALALIQHYLERRADGELLRRFDAAPLALDALAAASLERFALQAQAKRIALSTTGADGLVALADRAAAGHVLDNLLSNAIKYSAPDAPVEVHLGVGAPGHVRVAVLDRGPGLSASDRQRLFQRFVRLSTQPTAGEGSSGLGLALAKQDALQMRGDLWYEDRPGGGSCFTLELPLVL
jgi:signal transduction histidine kinase